MSKAAIKATYSDYKRVKSRKCHQIIFEVASEQWPEVYRALGEPDIDTSQWFAIAKMEGAIEQAPTPEKLDKNYAANAALLLQEISFLAFLAGTYHPQGFREISADEVLKQHLGIKSKSELNTNAQAAQKWRELRSEYEHWMRT